MDEEKIKILYNNLGTKYNLGKDIDEFKSKLSDPDKRKVFYDAVGAKYNLGNDIGEFETKLGLSNTEATVPTPDPTAVRRDQSYGMGGEYTMEKLGFMDRIENFFQKMSTNTSDIDDTKREGLGNIGVKMFLSQGDQLPITAEQRNVPLLPASKLMKEEEHPTKLRGAVKGLLNITEALSSAENIALMVATGGMKGLAQEVVGAYFAGEMVSGGVESTKQVLKYIDEGNSGKAAQHIVEGLVSFGAAGLSAKHTIKGETLPKAEKRKLIDQLSEEIKKDPQAFKQDFVRRKDVADRFAKSPEQFEALKADLKSMEVANVQKKINLEEVKKQTGLQGESLDVIHKKLIEKDSNLTDQAYSHKLKSYLDKTGDDFIVHQSMNKDGITKPTVRISDVIGLSQVKEIPTLSRVRKVTEPLGLDVSRLGLALRKWKIARYAFEEMGPWAMDNIYRPLVRAHSMSLKEHKRTSLEFAQMAKGLKTKDLKQLQIWDYMQQEGGKLALKEAGIKFADQGLLEKNPKLKEWHEAVQTKYAEYHQRLNDVRVQAGQKPFPAVQNYSTFWRKMDAAAELGLNPLTVNPKIINSIPEFKLSKHRKKMGPELLVTNALDSMHRYSHYALQYIHETPHLTKVREVVNNGKINGKSLKETAPLAHDFIVQYLNNATGNVAKRPHDAIISKFNSNITTATLAANFRTVMVQPMALLQTVTEIGVGNTMNGLYGLMTGRYHEALSKSEHLIVRQFDAGLSHLAMTAPARGKAKIAKIGLQPLSFTDSVTAAVTWLGAYDQALRKRYNENTARRYADDVTSRTQVAATKYDIAPVQYTATGRLFTMFQTFTIGQFNWLAKEVFGYKNTRVSKGELMKRAARYYIGGAMVDALFEDVLGQYSPVKSPIMEFKRALDDGEEFPTIAVRTASTFLADVPGIGGGLDFSDKPLGAGIGFIQDVAGVASDISKGEMPKVEDVVNVTGKLAGVPGTQQAVKMLKNKRKQDDKNKKYKLQLK